MPGTVLEAQKMLTFNLGNSSETNVVGGGTLPLFYR